jgi:predicted ribosome quality control (RQC) complex YloA/Tae2 family protein
MKKIICLSTQYHEVYVGKSWQENETLIKTSNPSDVWFHLENEPSCNVVLKNDFNIPLNRITKSLLKKCSLLVKQNTNKCIEHEKQSIVYTNIDNITLVGHGSVEFKNEQCVKYIRL